MKKIKEKDTKRKGTTGSPCAARGGAVRVLADAAGRAVPTLRAALATQNDTAVAGKGQERREQTMPVMALKRPTTIQNFNLVQAHREGWTIIEAYGPEKGDIQLRGVTCSDQNAWWQVARRARQGSSYHREALSCLSDREREQISLRFGPL